MKKVVVTGGAGFIGSHIVEHLIREKIAHPIVIDNLSAGKRENLDFPPESFTFIEGSVLNLDLLLNEFEGVDCVFHVAALKSVPASFDSPDAFFRENIIGMKNVLEAARLKGVRRVVFSSSSSVYGDAEIFPQIEGKETVRLSPYAISKFTCEDLCRMYHTVFGLETVSLRYFNVFGPRQDPHSTYAAVIPKFITMIAQDQAPTIFGDGEQSRDFTYVTNVVEGNMLGMTSPNAPGKTFNIALGDSISVNKLVTDINKCLGKNVTPKYAEARKGDILKSCADVSKAKQELSFTGAVSFTEGLQKTVDYFTDVLKRNHS